MFKKLKREIRLKKLKIECMREMKKMRYWKSELYDIEHGSCIIGEEWIIRNYGSICAYKRKYEDWIEESKKKLEEYWTEEERLRDS